MDPQHDVVRYPSPAHAPTRLPRHTHAGGGGAHGFVAVAILLLILVACPAPPGYSSCRSSGNDGGGDNGYWRPTVVAAFAGAQVGRALRRRFVGLLRSPVPCLASPFIWL
jgi:hypothetical protein